MKSNPQRGMALVVTLIMLSVVTVMAIVFLGISRRERTSVGVTVSMTDARLASDAGVAHAQAEILARIASRSNLYACDFFLSTNYISPAGFVSGLAHPTNVNYFFDTAGTLPVTGDDQLLNLANLMVDPRAPVFVTTNISTGQKEFRFYLDLNRNGRFETNGWVPVLSRGTWIGTNFLWGDPEWVGILERPDLPHSSSNRFIARYAYIVLPAGRSLDFNFIHNRVKRLAPRGDYLRNQGVGSWELNLAALYRNWLPDLFNAGGAGAYVYRPEAAAFNSGLAFDMAGAFYDYRSFATLLTNASAMLGARSILLSRNGIDDFGDDIHANGNRPTLGNNGRDYVDDDTGNVAWPAANYPGALFDVQELFRPNRVRVGALDFANVLLAAGGTLNDTTNRYALTRLLSQIGTDSLPASRGRVHLNYINGRWDLPAILPDGSWNLGAGVRRTNGTPVIVEGAETNLVAWGDSPRGRVDFVMLATDRILRSQMSYLFPGGLSEGIQVYPTNYYVGPTHRCAQLAANILDTTTRARFGTATNAPEFPTVFRPILDRWKINGNDVLGIVGFEEVPNAQRTVAQALALPWRDLSKPADAAAFQPGNNVMGIPWVVGAKKGWPNFNEFYTESLVMVTRRLQATKNPSTRQVTFQQSYEIGITNLFGLESWNAYQSNFPGPVTLFFTNVADVVLRDSQKDDNRRTQASVVVVTNLLNRTNLVLNNWTGQGFRVFTNHLTLVPKSAYFPGAPAGSALRPAVAAVQFDRTIGFPIPDWKLEITNRLVYALTARDLAGADRLVDLVTLNPLMAGFDINRWMIGGTNRFAQTNSADSQFWLTNRVGSIRRNNIIMQNPTAGITNQVNVSMEERLARSDWSSWSEDSIAGKQKERAIDEFRVFLGLPPIFDTRRTNTPALVVQVPFTATRRMVQRLSWMANDPLVHYHWDDLYDETYADTNKVVVMKPGGGDEGYDPNLPNLGRLNPRYQPWGGQAGKETANDDWARNPWVKDPWVTKADDWEFPTNALPNVGWLGRVHRGTPWQTVYLKSTMEPVASWAKYMGNNPVSPLIHPTNDWFLVDVFTTAPNANASRGLLSVNQTNEAAWAAVLGGVRYQVNTATASRDTTRTATYTNYYINTAPGPASIPPRTQPDTWLQFSNIVHAINTNRTRFFGGSYRTLGDILSTPALSAGSPFLNLSGLEQGTVKISDAVLEGLPQQILGLLKSDEPYFVVYSYGQSLRPAERSLVLKPDSPFFNLCTNYQIMGEALTKTAFRIMERKQGTNVFYDAVTESFSVLPLN